MQLYVVFEVYAVCTALHACMQAGGGGGGGGQLCWETQREPGVQGGSEWMTKFGLKGHANIHLLPAIKQATQ